MSLFDNLDDEEVITFNKPVYTFTITRQEALAEIEKQIRIYGQFKGFHEGHPSTKKMRRLSAIYAYIKENLK